MAQAPRHPEQPQPRWLFAERPLKLLQRCGLLCLDHAEARADGLDLACNRIARADAIVHPQRTERHCPIGGSRSCRGEIRALLQFHAFWNRLAWTARCRCFLRRPGRVCGLNRDALLGSLAGEARDDRAAGFKLRLPRHQLAQAALE